MLSNMHELGSTFTDIECRLWKMTSWSCYQSTRADFGTSPISALYLQKSAVVDVVKICCKFRLV